MLDSTFCSGPPLAFLRLLSSRYAPGEAAAAETEALAYFRRLHSCISRLEVVALDDRKAKAFVESLDWPLETWCRENVVVLVEEDFERLAEPLRQTS